MVVCIGSGRIDKPGVWQEIDSWMGHKKPDAKYLDPRAGKTASPAQPLGPAAPVVPTTPPQTAFQPAMPAPVQPGAVVPYQPVEAAPLQPAPCRRRVGSCRVGRDSKYFEGEMFLEGRIQKGGGMIEH